MLQQRLSSVDACDVRQSKLLQLRKMLEHGFLYTCIHKDGYAKYVQ